MTWPRRIALFTGAAVVLLLVVVLIVVATRSDSSSDRVEDYPAHDHDQPDPVSTRPDEDETLRLVKQFMPGYLSVAYGKAPATAENLPGATPYLRRRIADDTQRGAGTAGTPLRRLDPKVQEIEWLANNSLGIIYRVRVWDGETANTLHIYVSQDYDGTWQITGVQ